MHYQANPRKTNDREKQAWKHAQGGCSVFAIVPLVGWKWDAWQPLGCFLRWPVCTSLLSPGEPAVFKPNTWMTVSHPGV